MGGRAVVFLTQHDALASGRPVRFITLRGWFGIVFRIAMVIGLPVALLHTIRDARRLGCTMREALSCCRSEASDCWEIINLEGFWTHDDD